jgi:hypothetical protein
MSCGIAGATCHGDPNLQQTSQRPYLGDHDGGTNAATVITGLVGVPSNEDPKMNLVQAGAPSQSFVMHKLDGDECQYATVCNANLGPDAGPSDPFYGCGVQMPYQSPPLDPATRDTIRRWIAQGAKNN